MPDFSKLLTKPAGKGIKPPVLPIEVYPGVIRTFEYGDQNRNRTPYVRFHTAITDWPQSIPEKDRYQMDSEGGRQLIDLSKRQFYGDFYLTEDALHILDNFLRTCGIDIEGMTYEEVIQQTPGSQVLCRIGQYMNERTGEMANSRRLDNITGTARGENIARAAE